VFGHHALRLPHIAIRDRADDLNGLARCEIDLHNSTRLPDVNVRWRMIQRVNPHLEARLTKAIAAFLPIWRATRIDPMILFRGRSTN
jgi:hypothetical protein